MKKLVIAMAAAVLVISANAAAVKWSTKYEVGNGTIDGFTSATVAYLIDATVLTQATIYDAVVGGKTIAEAIGSNAVSSGAMSAGKITTQDLTVDATGSKTYYMALFDADLNAVYFSEQITKTLSNVGSQSYAFSGNSSINAIATNMSGFTSATGGWVAVPEPTSGLLMLLGMAGLALRRRRA